MKRTLYALTGFAWGIFVFNNEILGYAIFLSFVTILIDVVDFLISKAK